jgi:hypothetical protein
MTVLQLLDQGRMASKEEKIAQLRELFTAHAVKTGGSQATAERLLGGKVKNYEALETAAMAFVFDEDKDLDDDAVVKFTYYLNELVPVPRRKLDDYIIEVRAAVCRRYWRTLTSGILWFLGTLGWSGQQGLLVFVSVDPY